MCWLLYYPVVYCWVFNKGFEGWAVKKCNSRRWNVTPCFCFGIRSCEHYLLLTDDGFIKDGDLQEVSYPGLYHGKHN